MSDSETSLKRTPLYDCHARAGGKFVPFGGWEMPVQYSGLVNEHTTVRNAVGLFDVSHMGEVRVQGGSALEYLEYLTTNKVSSLQPGQAQYSMFLNEGGGVVDDIIVYMLGTDDYLICVNAANTEKDFAWMQQHLREGVEIENCSSSYAQLAIQGPKAQALVAEICGKATEELSITSVPAFTFFYADLQLGGSDARCIVARTGYTGEDGFEIFCPAAAGPALWDVCLTTGEQYGIVPAGLGARDTLRLEVCYPLHGHEISDDISPLSAGLGWVVKLDKGDFIGRQALVEQKELGVSPKLVGLEVTGRGIIREGTELFVGGTKVGTVTSGTKPPTVGKPIGLAVVPKEYSQVGTELEAEVRGRRFVVQVIPRPFYKRTN